MKDIKKSLSRQAKEILPDEKVKKNIRNGLYHEEGQKAYAHGGTEARRNNKKLYMIIAAVLAVAIVLCVTLPFIFNGSTSSIQLNIITSDDFYAYGAASAGSILEAKNSESNTAYAVKAAAKAKAADSLADGQQQAVDLVNEYIYYVEELLGESQINYSTTSASAVSGYQYSMEINYSNLLGEGVTYRMYYNETQTKVKTDGDETETLFDISGILEVNGIYYTIEGGKSIETETGETSNAIWFKAYTDSNSYILIKQEYEEETEDGKLETEQSTEIYVYTDNKLTESVVAEMESEDGETELELEITRDGVKNTLEFSYLEKNGQIILDVKARIDKVSYSFKIYVENDCYIYVLGSTEYSVNRY